MFPDLMTFNTQYLILPLFVIGFLLVDIGTVSFDNVVMDNFNSYEQDQEELKNKMRLMAKKNRERKLSEFIYTGFAFSGQARQDTRITDNL